MLGRETRAFVPALVPTFNQPSTAMTDQPTADTDVTSGTVPNVTGGMVLAA